MQKENKMKFDSYHTNTQRWTQSELRFYLIWQYVSIKFNEENIGSFLQDLHLRGKLIGKENNAEINK